MCIQPISKKIDSSKYSGVYSIKVPCGKCLECLRDKQNDWLVRLYMESKYHSNLLFFTLTYSNDSLPCRVDYADLAYPEKYAEFYGSYNECKAFASDDMLIRSTACKVDVQRFLKRMRTNYERKHGETLKMKYFICAEYGPNPKGTRRPHYHGVIMTDAEYFDLLPEFNEWSENYGRMEFKQVGFGRDQSSKVANYISKYCAKGALRYDKETGEFLPLYESRYEDIQAGFIERAWYIMSKNIGSRWFEENKEQWLRYVPVSSSIVGNWTLEDVEKFFASGTDRANLCAKEIDLLIDNFFVMDGDSTYSYKLPRYYRERLLCVKKSFDNVSLKKENGTVIPQLTVCQSFLQSPRSTKCELSGRTSYAFACLPEPITYETFVRKDVRYVAENFLSVAFAYRTSLRVMYRYQEEFNSLKISFPTLQDFEIDIRLLRQRARAKLYREQMSASSLRDFYNSNMWKNREFDYESDGVLDYNIFNQ